MDTSMIKFLFPSVTIFFLALFSLGLAHFGFYLITCLLILDYVLNKFELSEVVDFAKKTAEMEEEELPDDAWKID
jgi:hypothetical protein